MSATTIVGNNKQLITNERGDFFILDLSNYEIHKLKYNDFTQFSNNSSSSNNNYYYQYEEQAKISTNNINVNVNNNNSCNNNNNFDNSFDLDEEDPNNYSQNNKNSNNHNHNINENHHIINSNNNNNLDEEQSILKSIKEIEQQIFGVSYQESINSTTTTKASSNSTANTNTNTNTTEMTQYNNSPGCLLGTADQKQFYNDLIVMDQLNGLLEYMSLFGTSSKVQTLKFQDGSPLNTPRKNRLVQQILNSKGEMSEKKWIFSKTQQNNLYSNCLDVMQQLYDQHSEFRAAYESFRIFDNQQNLMNWQQQVNKHFESKIRLQKSYLSVIKFHKSIDFNAFKKIITDNNQFVQTALSEENLNEMYNEIKALFNSKIAQKQALQNKKNLAYQTNNNNNSYYICLDCYFVQKTNTNFQQLAISNNIQLHFENYHQLGSYICLDCFMGRKQEINFKSSCINRLDINKFNKHVNQARTHYRKQINYDSNLFMSLIVDLVEKYSNNRISNESKNQLFDIHKFDANNLPYLFCVSQNLLDKLISVQNCYQNVLILNK